MSESTEQYSQSPGGAIKRIEEIAGFHRAPVVLAAVGFVVTVFSSLLPYATVSISVFGGDIGAFEGSSPSAWFLSLPIGWLALLLGVVVLGCAIVSAGSDRSPSTEHLLAWTMTGTGLALFTAEFLELFWVGHRVSELAGFLGGSVDTSLAIGYLGLLFGAVLLTVAGGAALIRTNSKQVAMAKPFGSG